MSFSVTENVSAVTDVKALLSSLGFEPVNDTQLELVIEGFDQWANPSQGAYYATCGASGLQIAA